MFKLRLINPALLLGFVFLGVMIFCRPVNSAEVFDLSNYNPELKQDFQGWLMSEKLDGIRAIWDGKQLCSKRGNPIYAPDWFVKQLPPFAMDGELWTKRGDFENIASIVLSDRLDNRWQNLSYQIFEVPNQTGGLLNRLMVLQQWLQDNPREFIKVIPQELVLDNSAFQARFQQVIAEGGEGLVLRKADEAYLTGRLTTAFKVKATDDAECKVVGYTDGKGRFAGMVGALQCQLLPEQINRLFPELLTLNRPVDIKLGSGLSDALRKQPPKIGEIVTFEYSGLTAKGLPRFARFKRVRKNFDN